MTAVFGMWSCFVVVMSVTDRVFTDSSVRSPLFYRTILQVDLDNADRSGVVKVFPYL